MNLEFMLERLKEDIRRISQYGSGQFRLCVQVLDSSLIAEVVRGLSLEELARVEFQAIDEMPEWEPVAQQILALPRFPLSKPSVPNKPLPPVHAKTLEQSIEEENRIQRALRTLHAVAGKRFV